ncbi:mechanosensitive ion channel family protein [Microbacterium lacus]|uniref:mechanosensitive ion channel family protein n=1 Tax=Microbacterium lacus TaxID=415217 RepID=UPI00384A5ECA
MDFSQLLTVSISWWDVVFALIAVIAGWILSRFAKRGTLAVLAHVPNVTPALALFGARVAQYSVLLLGFGIALALLGANIQPLLAMSLIVIAVAALVMRGVADNFAAGVLIQTRKSVLVGEDLMVEGPDGEPIIGTVTELNSRAVIMQTLDGRTVHTPNSKLMTETLVNFSRHGERRSEVQVRIERGATPVEEVLKAVTDAAAHAEGVLQSTPARSLVSTVSPERIAARVQFWHAPAAAVATSAAVVAAISGAITAAGWKGTVTSDVMAPPLISPDRV